MAVQPEHLGLEAEAVKLKERIALFFAARGLRKQVVGWAERSLGRPLTRKESQMFKNWQTTILGIVMAAAQLHQGGLTWGNAAIAALMAAFGLVAKDHNVTGGSVSQ